MILSRHTVTERGNSLAPKQKNQSEPKGSKRSRESKKNTKYFSRVKNITKKRVAEGYGMVILLNNAPLPKQEK